MNNSLIKYKKGNQYINIHSAVTSIELNKIIDNTVDLEKYTMTKFIPASGAATRMFKDFYTFLDTKKETEYVNSFFENLNHFAFYHDLEEFIELNKFDTDLFNDRVRIIDYFLNHLKYGALPKALIPFHSYGSKTKTPIDEHIFEAEQYLDSGSINLHFTISKEHERLFNRYIESIISNKNDINITYSFQKSETDTLAVNQNNEPFILNDGDILYRPGGHGSLISNLNDLEEDIIFIKNVDNVVHKSNVKDTIEWKNKLAVTGVKIKEQIDIFITQLLSDEYDLNEIEEFINNSLHITLKSKLTKERALKLLNRPLRVCGVVKNEGDPGGGPYIVDDGDYLSLQICEAAEINLEDNQQLEIFNTSEYFNPVDLVCFTKDYKGDKFNLLDFVNEDRYFISEKTYEGRPLKAIEHPGLWNGAMHYWNTIFVEVPQTTFNPVKSVNDLLKDGHREKVKTV